jgi:CheY-like chemotaxis protein
MAHILVIDDDQQFRDMLVQMLQGDRHDVSAAADGAEALKVLQQRRPDLIITDILMPNMDGVETIMELSRRGADTPVIAMSGGRRSISADFNLNSADLLGVKATLAKPFSRAELREAIKKAVPQVQ